jgi:hypothetical protein
MKIYKIPFFSIALLLVGCQADEPQPTQQQAGTLSFTTSVQQFDGEASTRVNLSGYGFEPDDKFKIKIVCPFSEHTELGESTYGGSFDAFYLLKWHADSLATLTSDDHCDIDGDYTDSNSPDIYSRFLAQPTPYVFTAQTWSQEQVFVDANSTRVEQYSNVFHANQTKPADYKASDLMWAQTIQQTGSYNVHLSFKHMMAAILVTVSADASLGITENAVLTLEGMPDIDQAEVIVGDYYAAKSKVNSYNYGYKSKHSCTQAHNGTVIGVAVVDDDQKKSYTKAISDISQDGTYTAYNAGNKTYRLIVPPCALSKNPTFWLRDGEKRYSMQMTQTTFEAGKLYKVKMTI